MRSAPAPGQGTTSRYPARRAPLRAPPVKRSEPPPSQRANNPIECKAQGNRSATGTPYVALRGGQTSSAARSVRAGGAHIHQGAGAQSSGVLAGKVCRLRRGVRPGAVVAAQCSADAVHGWAYPRVQLLGITSAGRIQAEHGSRTSSNSGTAPASSGPRDNIQRRLPARLTFLFATAIAACKTRAVRSSCWPN